MNVAALDWEGCKVRLILLVSVLLALTACNSAPTVDDASETASREPEIAGHLQPQNAIIPSPDAVATRVLVSSPEQVDKGEPSTGSLEEENRTPPKSVTTPTASIIRPGQGDGGGVGSAPATDTGGDGDATPASGAIVCFDGRFPVVSGQALVGMASTDPQIAESVASKVGGLVTQRYFSGRIVLVSFDAAAMGLEQAIDILSADPHVRYAEPNAVVSIHDAPKCGEGSSRESSASSPPDDSLGIAP